MKTISSVFIAFYSLFFDTLMLGLSLLFFIFFGSRSIHFEMLETKISLIGTTIVRKRGH